MHNCETYLGDKFWNLFIKVEIWSTKSRNNVKTFRTLTNLMRQLIIGMLYHKYYITKLSSFACFTFTLSFCLSFPFFALYFLCRSLSQFAFIHFFRSITSLSFELSGKLVFHTLYTIALTKNIPDYITMHWLQFIILRP